MLSYRERVESTGHVYVWRKGVRVCGFAWLTGVLGLLCSRAQPGDRVSPSVVRIWIGMGDEMAREHASGERAGALFTGALWQIWAS